MTSYRKINLPHSSIKNLSSYSIYNLIYVPKYAKGGNFIGKGFKFVGEKVGLGLKWVGEKLLSSSTPKQTTENVTYNAASRTANRTNKTATFGKKTAENAASRTANRTKKTATFGKKTAENAASRTANRTKKTATLTVDVGKETAENAASRTANRTKKTATLTVDVGKETAENAASRTAKRTKKTATLTVDTGKETAENAALGTAKRTKKTATLTAVDAGKEAAKKESIFRKSWNWYKKSWTNPWLNTGRLMYLNADLRSPDTKLYGLPDIAILHTLFPSEGIDNMSHKYLGGSNELALSEDSYPADEIVISNEQIFQDLQWLSNFLSNYE